MRASRIFICPCFRQCIRRICVKQHEKSPGNPCQAWLYEHTPISHRCFTMWIDPIRCLRPTISNGLNTPNDIPDRATDADCTSYAHAQSSGMGVLETASYAPRSRLINFVDKPIVNGAISRQGGIFSGSLQAAPRFEKNTCPDPSTGIHN